MRQLRPSPAAVHTGAIHTWNASHIRRALLAYQVGIWMLAVFLSVG
jgi:hypothetical protein